jgi:hypothetical protein
MHIVFFERRIIMKLRKSLVCSSVLAAVAMLAVAGCSSDSSSTDASATTTAAEAADTSAADADTEADTDADTDAETDADTEADTDAADDTEAEDTEGEDTNEVSGNDAAGAEEYTTADPEEFAAAPYHGYLCFQTPVYSFRNACDDASYGINGTSNTDEIGYDIVHAWDGSTLISDPGEFQDAAITGDGTYTVSVTGLAWNSDEFASQNYYNLIFLSTDIPVDALNSDDFSITVDELKVGDNAVELDPELILNNWEDTDEDDELTTGLQISLQNIWSDNAKIGSYDVNASSMSITFTITGLDSYEGSSVIE